ncbi:MAG: hypothetical protein H0T42_00480 [Deltaproteobacteria bacterium]|nr:hypothetical protein [Deltaproteobacteria bacterium]
MVRQLVLGSLLFLASAAQVHANGRPAATSTINFRQGNEQHIAAGMTFGLLVSQDGGATWRWICEDAIKYSGMYDPDYAYTSTGALFATTFDGSLVNRDGCSFNATPFAKKFMSSVALGPTGHLFMGTVHPEDLAMSDPGDSKIYKSTDDGMTFPISAAPAALGLWWSSIEVAPADANRIYVSGYRLVTGDRLFELYKSENGGTSYTPITTTGITTTRNSTIEIVGISRLNIDHLYARVTYQNVNSISDAIYRSTNAGTSWTKILEKQDELAFVIRANGDLVAAGKNTGLQVSRTPSNGAAWEVVASAPHVGCLVENAAGEVWACTQNFGSPQVMSDGAGIMKSTDLATWTPVLRYQDIVGPAECAAGTLQRDLCVDRQPSSWCALKNQFGITANPTNCPAVFDSPPDASGADNTIKPPDPGCCDNNAGGAPVGLALGALVAMILIRPRRRRA